MELVYQTFDESEARGIVGLLEKNGIPAFITNLNANRLRKLSTGGMGIFVHLNSQRDEAISLINNPSYRVRNRVNVERFYKEASKKTSPEKANNYILVLLFRTLALLVVISVLVIYIASRP